MSEPGRSAESIAVFGNRIDEIGAAAQLAQDFGASHGLASGMIHDLCVAFDEALSNVVKYGYRDDARHEISVRLAIAGTHVVAEIEDDGVPFDPLSAPPPRLEGGIDERPIGGLGIYLLRQLMDEVRYVRRGNRNVLVMKKRISEDPAPSAAEEATVISDAAAVGASLPGRAIGIPSTGGVVRQVGRYQVLEKLGEGAMATVYKAYDPGIDRPLVIKFLHAELCRDAEYRMRFLREGKAAGILTHPNIVTVFDVGEIEDRPYIAMELLDGVPLNELLKDNRGLALREVLDIGIQLASALGYAHSKGIFHRDVKPSNIIRLSGSGAIKLADFGIAHMPSAGADRTQAGTVMGTPHYMSPEQALGEKIDARSDLWAVGVILYQLVSGRRPFEADTIVTLLYRIANDSPTPVTEVRSDVPASLRRIIARCLNKQADKRFQSGKELADALAKVLRESDETAARAGQKHRMPLKVKLALAMAALVAVTMGLTSAFVAHRQYQAMLSETVGHGSSLAKLMAVESAAPALSEDWVGIDVFAQEVARALDLQGLSVIDRAGVVRVSIDASSVGQPAPVVQGDAIPSKDAAVSVLRHDSRQGSVFTFETPIRFQDKQIGSFRLSLPEEPLAAVAGQSWRLMLLLLAITAATVTLATYLLVERYSRPLRLLRESLDEIGEGRYDCRIAEQRADEFGEVYRAFDAMAARLEDRSENEKAADAGSTHPGSKNT